MPLRRLNLLVALATLLLAALSFTWALTQHRDIHFSFHFRHTRYTVHSFAGRITLATPMTLDSSTLRCWSDGVDDGLDPSTPQQLDTVSQTVSRIRSTDIQWRFEEADREFHCDFVKASGLQVLFDQFYNEANGIGGRDGKTGLAALFGPDPQTLGNERARLLPLVTFLDDPDKTIAAHAAFCRLGYARLLYRVGFTWNPETTFFGLPFKRDPTTGSFHPDFPATPDLASAWRSAFDQRVFSVSYATLTLTSALPALLRITRPRRIKPTFRRWSLNLATSLSLTAFTAILFLALCPRLPGGWAGAYFFTTRNHQPAETLTLLDWHTDTISVAFRQGPVGRGEWAQSHDAFITLHERPWTSRPHSMLAYQRNSGPRYDSLDFQARFYAAAPPFALLPVLWLLTTLHRKRPSPGHCPHCHYDLRALHPLPRMRRRLESHRVARLGPLPHPDSADTRTPSTTTPPPATPH